LVSVVEIDFSDGLGSLPAAVYSTSSLLCRLAPFITDAAVTLHPITNTHRLEINRAGYLFSRAVIRGSGLAAAGRTLSAIL